MDLLSNLTKPLRPVTRALTKTSTGLLGNPYVSAVLTLFLILYASMVRPPLPAFLMNLFDNGVFRLLFLFGLAFMASQNFQVALLVAVVFTVVMNLLNEQKMIEGFMAYQQLDSQE